MRLLLAVLALAGVQSAQAQTRFTTEPVTTASAGRPYVYNVAAQGVGTVQITAPIGLPEWLTLSETGNGTATLTGTPPTPGLAYTVFLRAEDDVCRGILVILCASQTFQINVALNAPPTVAAPIPDRTTAAGARFELDLSGVFSDPDGDPLTLSAFGLPPSLSLSGNVIAGTPTLADALLSPYYVVVTASDGRGGSATDDFVLTISPNSVPTVIGDGIPDATATEGSPFELNVAQYFSDPDGDPLTFAATGLPQGFALSGGVISASAPSAAAASGSPYTVTVTANDGRGASVSDTFVLAVRALDRADVLIESVTATPAPALRNSPVEWNVRLANRGPSPSGSLEVTLEFSGTPFTFTSNDCTLSIEADRQRLVCTVPPLANGANQTLTVAGSAAQAGDVWVTARLSTPATQPVDPDPSNNSASGGLNVGEALVTDAAQLVGGAAGNAVAVGDANGDGFAEAAVARAGGAPVLLLNTEAPGGLHAGLAAPGDRRRGLSGTPLEFPGGTAGTAVAFADLDGDGDLDVVVANGAGTPTRALRNAGNGAFDVLAALGAANASDRAVAIADVNGDGLNDVVVASATGNRLHLNQGGTAFGNTPLPSSNGRGALDVALVNVVGNPLPDLVLVYEGGPTVVHENIGGGQFGAAVNIDTSAAVSVAAGDFNGDGYPDLVLARTAPASSGLPSNPVYVNNRSGGFVASGTLGATPTAKVLTADFDRNGTIDVLAINTSGAHQIFLGDGNGGFRLHGQLLVGRGARGGAVGPVGLLQTTDIVLTGSEGLAVFFNDGRGRFGLGDTTRPVITLVGPAEVTVEVQSEYVDAGATASDDVDGALIPMVDNPVNTAVIGSYTVTYTAMDKAGNAAIPVTRTVKVAARAAEGGGGGGALGILPAALLAAALYALRRRNQRTTE